MSQSELNGVSEVVNASSTDDHNKMDSRDIRGEEHREKFYIEREMGQKLVRLK